ncbi:dihydrofolate reductase [Ectobacillus ponti]|uniref:Dihydrofolate reductase n=1 Tax=Ectobacillus ponti TaxID=2961894 RepID=A0AA41X5A8_9BACI|nr:dihydrofolate reductase [Ectobacillus ponti]MCP8968962.1 dihydrofolate reductase [Ectobacillus ponti]
MISMIAAMDENNLIGRNNALPWHLPADLAHFKRVTTGHTIVMGRNTFASIGRPLPNRRNMVLTRDPAFQAEGCEVIHSLQDIPQEEEVFIIGGAKVYEQAISFADRLYITRIHETFSGDTYFPAIDSAEWELVSCEAGQTDERNVYAHDFLLYKRK